MPKERQKRSPIDKEVTFFVLWPGVDGRRANPNNIPHPPETAAAKGAQLLKLSEFLLCRDWCWISWMYFFLVGDYLCVSMKTKTRCISNPRQVTHFCPHVLPCFTIRKCSAPLHMLGAPHQTPKPPRVANFKVPAESCAGAKRTAKSVGAKRGGGGSLICQVEKSTDTEDGLTYIVVFKCS